MEATEAEHDDMTPFRTGYVDDMPSGTAYGPTPSEPTSLSEVSALQNAVFDVHGTDVSTQAPRPGIELPTWLANGRIIARSTTGLADLEQIYLSRQTYMQRAANHRFMQRWRAENRHLDLPADPSVPCHDGTDDRCTICQHTFQQGQWVSRLRCNHLFHSACWTQHLTQAEGDAECLNCRGPPIPKAHFRHMGTPNRSDAQQQFRRMSGLNADDTGSSFTDATSGGNDIHQRPESPPPVGEIILPLMTAEQLSEYSMSWSLLSPEEYFRQQQLSGYVAPMVQHEQHECLQLKTVSRTKIPGRNSLLVDLGSKINAMGAETEKEFAATAEANGYDTNYVPRVNRLWVNGVGAGAAKCDFEVIAPIAVKFAEHTATKETFQANITEGVGANLPAILGLDSMQAKDSVLILRKGQEFMAFPGPGGYEIKWSPGTKLLPMEHAPSGHLVIPCDRFKELPSGSANTEQFAFWTDHKTDNGGKQVTFMTDSVVQQPE